MAKEQWKKIGVWVAAVAFLVTVLGSLVGFAFVGGSELTGAKKDIVNDRTTASRDTQAVAMVAARDTQAVAENQAEDRKAIVQVAKVVADLKDQHNADFKELKQDSNDAKLRDERQATQYTAILSHMQQQTNHVKKADESISDMKTDIGKIQVKIDTLTKD